MLSQPIRLVPQFKSMLWGGSRLAPFFHQPSPREPWGEAWLLSDVDGSESRIANLDLTLRMLIREHGDAIMGRAKLAQGRFPLLLKLIDAKLPLSVQVHPNDEQANARKPGHAGKTEAWYVLDSGTGLMYSGFKLGMTEHDFRNAMVTKNVPETLHSFLPKKGDCLFLNAGTVHAIGSETFLFECQQTSDITYRLYDWDRVDAKGQPRELHIDDGLACSNFAGGPCEPVTPKMISSGRDQLVDCPYFSMNRLSIKASQSMTIPTDGACVALVCVEGLGSIDSENFQPGDTFLIPASLKQTTITAMTAMTIMECRPF